MSSYIYNYSQHSVDKFVNESYHIVNELLTGGEGMRTYLRNLRLENALSQQYVADSLSIKRQYYSMIENGSRQKNISIALLTKLAVTLNVPVTQLIDAENQNRENASN